MNPYGFVRLGAAGPRRPVTGHHRFDGLSGELGGRLTSLTALFIPRTQQVVRSQHARLDMLRDSEGRPILPGSSLKGVIRSVAEALSGSCCTLPQTRQGKLDYDGRSPVSYKLPRDFERCEDKDRACPCCRIFGLLSRDEVFAGKATIGDARAIGRLETKWFTTGALMEPKPRHRPWYGDPRQPDAARGRKFYYHRPQGPASAAAQTQYNKTIEAVLPGSQFEFVAEYSNLTEEELALLVYSLVLEEPMRHKLGMGKPLGLGSTQIEIVRWKRLDAKSRYQQLGGGTDQLSSEALAEELQRWRQLYHRFYQASRESLQDLRRVWAWDPSSRVEVKYPGQDWFRQNPKTPLEQAP